MIFDYRSGCHQCVHLSYMDGHIEVLIEFSKVTGDQVSTAQGQRY